MLWAKIWRADIIATPIVAALTKAGRETERAARWTRPEPLVTADLILSGANEPKSTGSVEICQTAFQTPLELSTMRYLISYDLTKPEKDYPKLIAALTAMKAEKVLYSEWVINRDSTTPLDVANYVLQFMDADDRILVTEMPDNYAYRNLLNKRKAA
jgi:hypothetical protein